MRTNIDLDDDLLAAAMKATGETTKKVAVTKSLEIAVRLAKQSEAFEALYGAGWDGDLDAMRRGKDRSAEAAE